ncbi:MAG: thioredoxin-dependent thiol peroxidase [Calditrichaeota bacterium]|nr:thioredoxin-dependent thiol peroxidase [Calditrichota bacterium]
MPEDTTPALPKVGSPAPDFGLPDESSKVVRLADHQGRSLVLYFYPKDFTSGCTKESCDFRDNYARIQKAGATILGVSPDTPESHTKFIAEHSLPFSLLADTAQVMLNAYGVWGTKSMYGREYEGVIRTTVLIDSSGTVRRVWSPVKVDGHAKEVLAAVEALAK